MEVIKEYKEFSIKNNIFNTQEVIDVTKYIVQKFPFKFIVNINTDFEKSIAIDLGGNFENTTVKGLYWKYFSNQELLELEEKFHLTLEQAYNRDKADDLIAYCRDKSLDIALRTLNNRTYAMIFYLDLPDLYRGAGVFQGTLYVHSVFEIKCQQSS
ncbi:hypothetical protein ACI76O_11240 [Capnocytophaga cynodegmi]|uniref:hypothetical protein n=1 Tax=Capnocytophaga cynodegmi TaxID=28189 RepID=UPI00385E8E9C